VLAADTIVVAGGRILGKPSGAEDAASMLRQLAGRRHEVTTAYRVQRGAAAAERAVSTAVTFRLLAPAEIDAYVSSGEWQGKAGGYAIQGIAAVFATELRGSLTNVIGLPLAEVIADLQAVGGLAGWPPASFGGGA
jgi:septum formation protein